jgi:tetratricopeptide (TPR) repeat protein
MIAMLLEAQNKKTEAIQRYEEILRMEPNAAVAANNLAWIYAERGENLDLALQYAQKAKQELASSPIVSDTLGWVYYKKQLASLAVPLLEQSVTTDGQNPLFRYHLGMAYVQLGDFAKAAQTLKEALRLRSDFPGAEEARQTLAHIGG